MIFALLGLVIGTLVLGFSVFVNDSFTEKKIKSAPHEAYVIGVNKFLIPYDQWRISLDAALDKITNPYDEIEYPDDYVYLAPIPNPNSIQVGQAGIWTNAFTGALEDHGSSVPRRQYSGGMDDAKRYDRPVRKPNPNIVINTPNAYRRRVDAERNALVSHSKECGKCLQPILESSSARYCRVCDDIMKEAKREEEASWKISASWTDQNNNDITYTRYVNLLTGRARLITEEKMPDGRKKRIAKDYVSPQTALIDKARQSMLY